MIRLIRALPYVGPRYSRRGARSLRLPPKVRMTPAHPGPDYGPAMHIRPEDAEELLATLDRRGVLPKLPADLVARLQRIATDRPSELRPN